MAGRAILGLRLEVRDLAAERGGRPLFAGLSFTLAAGEALGITGPNGAGKSTLLRIVAGLLPPAEGTLVLDPPDAEDEDAPLRERAHYLGHADALKGAMTAVENLGFAAAVAARPALSPVEALRRFGLAHVEDLPCAYLSAGQRRRVALARLLVAARPLWLLDEPTTALDAASQAVFGTVMRDHLAAGGLIVAATHAPLGLDPLRSLALGSA